MSQKTINIVLAALIVVAIGVAVYVRKDISVTNVTSPNLAGTTNLDSLTLGDDLTVDKTSTLTGTTTVAQMLFPIGASISTAATGTAITLYSNTTGPKICFGETGALSLRNTGTFSPSVVVSVGHSTSSVATTNAIASSTIATSTPGTSFFSTVPFAANEFILPNGSELMAIVGDITNTEASTTHMTNLTLDARLLCSEIAI